MKFFSYTLFKRNTALLVLLVCLFAVASGALNACLLEVRGTHSHGAAAEAGEALAISPGHAGAVASHDDNAQAFKAPCLKVCDEGTSAFAKQDLTVSWADPGPAPLLAVLWTAAIPVVSAVLRRDDRLQPVAPELPLRVRYSRLVL